MSSVATGKLLKAVEQLSPMELDQFVSEVIALRAQRHAPCLNRTESQLLQIINRGLPEDLRQDYSKLRDKRIAETLSTQEHAELLRLTDQVERFDAERLQALVELAQLRKTTLGALANDLDIQAPSDG